MRIIGGKAGGRRFRLPKGCRLRPTSDMVREALFNILPSMTDRSFLDLYAGSGTVGLEALSRGAGRSVFVERDPRLAKAIQNAAQTFGLAEGAEVVTSDVRRALAALSRRGQSFHFAFIDPPYEEGLIQPTLNEVASGNLIVQAGTVVVQHAVAEDLREDSVSGLVRTDRRQYGDTLLSFWIRE